MDIGIVLTVIWPYLALMYLVDSIHIVRGGQRLFSGVRWRELGVRGPGVRLAGLLPWEWSVLATREPPLFSERGVYVGDVPFRDEQRPLTRDDLHFLPYNDLGEVKRDGRKVVAGGRNVFQASTVIEASQLASRIRTLRELPEAERSKALEKDLARSLDVELIRRTAEELREASSLLIGSSSLLFIVLLFLVPVSLVFRLPSSVLWAEVGVALGAWLTSMVLWWRIHRVYFPADRADRLEETLILVLFPVGAVHSFSKLTRRAFSSWDFAALTAALAPSKGSEGIRREYIRSSIAAETETVEDLSSAWSKRARALEVLAEGTMPGLFEERGPVPVSSSCPLCGATYREGVDLCADCGVTLEGGKSGHDPANESVIKLSKTES